MLQVFIVLPSPALAWPSLMLRVTYAAPVLTFCCNKILFHWSSQKKAEPMTDIFKKHFHGEEPANYICFTLFWQTRLGFVCSGIVVSGPISYPLKARPGVLPACPASPRCCTISVCSGTHRAQRPSQASGEASPKPEPRAPATP